MLQGVAIVDNVQDEDWNDVEMTLVSANPISFIQPLYHPIKPSRKRMGGQGVSSSDPFVAERAQNIMPMAPGSAPMLEQEMAESGAMFSLADEGIAGGAWGGTGSGSVC